MSSSNGDNAIYLYNKTGQIIEEKTFGTGVELKVYFDEMAEWIKNYNGQSVYFERIAGEIEARKAIIIP